MHSFNILGGCFVEKLCVFSNDIIHVFMNENNFVIHADIRGRLIIFISLLYRSFSSEMQKSEVCILVPTFLDLEDFDTHQKVTAAMISLLNACHNDFKSETIRNRLKKLLKTYDPDPDYEDSLHSTIDRDLRSVLYDELKHLIKRVSDDSSSISSQYLLKLEL